MFCHIDSDVCRGATLALAGRGMLKLLYLGAIRVLKAYPHECFLVFLRLRLGIGAPDLW